MKKDKLKKALNLIMLFFLFSIVLLISIEYVEARHNDNLPQFTPIVIDGGRIQGGLWGGRGSGYFQPRVGVWDSYGSGDYRQARLDRGYGNRYPTNVRHINYEGRIGGQPFNRHIPLQPRPGFFPAEINIPLWTPFSVQIYMWQQRWSNPYNCC